MESKGERMTKLNCPFCGCEVSIAVKNYDYVKTRRYSIVHPDNGCILKGYESHKTSARGELIDKWNSRINESDGKMKEVHNAQIVRAELSGWDDGYTMLTYCLTLEMDNGFSLGYGVHNLGGRDQKTYAAEDILRLMEVAGAKDWCDLKGKYVRIEFESEGMGTAVKNKRLGHITKDIWHDVDEIYRKEIGECENEDS